MATRSASFSSVLQNSVCPTSDFATIFSYSLPLVTT